MDGQQLGDHEGGHLPFYFDITDRVFPGRKHHLKVRVDNRIDSASLPPRLFQGHNLGWHPFGGLHRSVLIEVCPPVYCFKLQVDTKMEPDQGLVHVSALFHCPAGKPDALQTTDLGLFAADGQVLAQANSPIHWDDAGQFGIAGGRFNIPAPRLWEPDSPYLYRLEAKTEYERCETDFGFRTIQARDGKLWLNGKPILLKGVCRHQEDRADGLAQNPDSIQRELEIIQSMHGNFLRLAHYPHSSETLDFCDQLGLATWVEIPLYQVGLGIIRFLFDKTKRDTGKTLRALPGIIWKTNTLGNPDLLLKARDELLKMIERDRNHPSVLFWGLGNECWTFNPAGAKALVWLREQAEAFDSTRLFTYAAFALPVLGPLYERSFESTDVVSVNEYFGWYYGKAQDAGAYLRSLARKHPNKPLLVTETGSDTVRGEHTSQVPPARGYSEEYQAWYLEEQWRQMRSVPTFSGLSIWVLKDFLCPEYREDNPLPFYNLKGLLNRDGQPKAALETVRRLYGGKS
jgi:beta-glucuronidase